MSSTDGPWQERLVVALMRDLDDRAGFSLGFVDAHDLEQWAAEWEVIVAKGLDAARRAAIEECVVAIGTLPPAGGIPAIYVSGDRIRRSEAVELLRGLLAKEEP